MSSARTLSLLVALSATAGGGCVFNHDVDVEIRARSFSDALVEADPGAAPQVALFVVEGDRCEELLEGFSVGGYFYDWVYGRRGVDGSLPEDTYSFLATVADEYMCTLYGAGCAVFEADGDGGVITIDVTTAERGGSICGGWECFGGDCDCEGEFCDEESW